MKKTLLLLLFIITSCISQKSIEYHISKGNTQSILVENIKNYKQIGYDVFLILGYEDKFKTIDIVPTKNLNKKLVQGIKVTSSNRKLYLAGNYYNVFFDYDNELAGKIRKTTEDGEQHETLQKETTIYDNATTLYFDEDWNFIKKSSLIKFK